MSTASAPPATRLPRVPRHPTKLPIVELDRTIVALPRKHIAKPTDKWPVDPSAITTTTFGHAKLELPFRAWPFYHAAAKTELARSFTNDEVRINARGFSDLTHTLLDWYPNNLRLRDGGVFSRKDASRTYYAGRFGEAVLYLFMIHQGYVYWDHLPSLVERAMNKAAIAHAEQVRTARVIKSRLKHTGEPDKQPDYAFETPSKEVALAEAKGSFVMPETTATSVKGDLAYGLLQLDAWRSLISPAPRKTFVVGTYLRERSDPHIDPSLIAYVDPDGGDNAPPNAVPFPDNWIRRGNYGAWLLGMGFLDAAIAVRSGLTAEIPARAIVIMIVGRQRFAVVFYSPLTGQVFSDLIPWALHEFWFHRLEFQLDLQVLGLEYTILRVLEKTVATGDEQLLTDLPIVEIDDQAFPDWFSGSVMPDGSLYGSIHFGHGHRPVVEEVESFRL